MATEGDRNAADDLSGLPDLGVGRDERSALRRWLPRVVVLLVLAVLMAAGWLAVRGLQVARALEAAVPLVEAVRADVAAGEVASAVGRLPALAEHATAARAATADPVWRAASTLPWLGDQLDAVSDVVAAFGLVADDVAPALAEVGTAIDPDSLAPVDGRIDLAPVAAAAAQLQVASRAATQARVLVDGIDTGPLVGPLASRVEDVRGSLAEAADTLQVASTAATLLPPMLGASGTRQYLVLVLNPAELRSAGGIVGAVALLAADDGAVSLTEHRAARALARYDTAVLSLPAVEEQVHGDQLGRWMQNVSGTPDFPRTAALAAEMWRLETGTSVDGVIAVDPVALSYVLEVTGPVEEPSGTALTAPSVVEALLFDAYARFPDPDATDTFFSGAAGSVFAALASGHGETDGLVPALGRAAGERRVSLWSAVPAEQELIGPTVLGGGFLSGGADAAAGAFLDDGTGTKVGYFLDVAPTVSEVTCASDGGTARVRLQITSRVPTDLSTLPAYVVWDGSDTAPTGIARTNVTFYAPVGGRIVQVLEGSAALGGVQAIEAGREAFVLTSTLEPGQSRTYDVDVVLPPGQTSLGLWSTPTVGSEGRVPPVSCQDP